MLSSYGRMSMVRMLGQEHFVPSLNSNNVPITDSGKTGLPCKPPAQREQSMVLRSMYRYHDIRVVAEPNQQRDNVSANSNIRMCS